MIGTLVAKSKVNASYDHLNNRDVKRFLAAWHEDATWIYPGDTAASGEFKGKETIEAWFVRFMEQFPKMRITPRAVCVESVFDMIGSNVVAVNWDEETRNKEGHKSRFNGVTVITVKLGKAVCAQEYIFATDAALRKAWGE
jgi:ketosteroid isomerase-like protein